MRRILYAGLGLLGLVATAAVVLWLARVPLAERYLDTRLERAGFPDASFEVASVGWNRLEIAPLALGPGPAPAARTVVVRFTPRDLLRGRLGGVEVTVTGLRAGFVQGPDGPRLAGWPGSAGAGRTAAPGPGEAGAALGAVPTLHVRDARVTLDSPVGRWVTAVDADVEGGASGVESARIDAGIRNERLVVDGELAARYDGARIEGSARLRENDGFGIEISGHVADPLAKARAHVDYRIDMPAAADLPWPFLPGAPPTAGRASLEGSAEGRIRAAAPPATPGGWIDALEAGGWRGDYRIEANDLAMSARFDGLAASVAGRWRAADGRISVATAGDGRLRIARVAEPLRERLPAPRAAAVYLAGPMRVQWEGGDWLRVERHPGGDGLRVVGLPRLRVDWPRQPGAVSVQARAEADLGPGGRPRGLAVPDASVDARGLRVGDIAVGRIAVVGGLDGLLGEPAGELDVSVDLPTAARAGVTAGDVALRLPLRIAAGEDGARIELREPGLVRAGELALPGGLSAPAGVAAEVAEAAVRLAEAPDYRAEIRVDGFVLERVRRPGQESVPASGSHPLVDVEGATVEIDGDAANGAPGRIALEVSALELPGRAVRASGLRATLRPDGFERWLRFEAGRIARAGPDAAVAPVTLSGRVERRADGLVIAGAGRAGDGAVPFRLQGRTSPSGRSGQLAIDVPTLAFEPGALQPGVLGPAFERFERVAGRAGGSLRLAWEGTAIDTSAVARIRGLDFTLGAARVLGLEGEVRLAHLRPPRTGAPQHLSARAIEAGVRVGSPTLAFSIEAGSAGRRVHVVAAQGDVVDGRVAVRDWRFDPLAQVYDPTLQVEGISLGKLLERLSIVGLEGSGTLTGALPVSVAPGGIAIRDGRLRGVDGTLQYRSERAQQLLADADRSVELMLRALKDFRYQQLEIGVNRELDGESAIRVRMEGRNPDVLDGQRFDFNVALTGDVQPLLEALARGRELTDQLIERNLRMRRSE